MHGAEDISTVMRQMIAARLWSAFFILIALDVRTYEGDASGLCIWHLVYCFLR